MATCFELTVPLFWGSNVLFDLGKLTSMSSLFLPHSLSWIPFPLWWKTGQQLRDGLWALGPAATWQERWIRFVCCLSVSDHPRMTAVLSGEIFFFLSSSHFSPLNQHLMIDFLLLFLCFWFCWFQGCVCMFVCWTWGMHPWVSICEDASSYFKGWKSYLALNAKSLMLGRKFPYLRGRFALVTGCEVNMKFQMSTGTISQSGWSLCWECINWSKMLSGFSLLHSQCSPLPLHGVRVPLPFGCLLRGGWSHGVAPVTSQTFVLAVLPPGGLWPCWGWLSRDRFMWKSY